MSEDDNHKEFVGLNIEYIQHYNALSDLVVLRWVCTIYLWLSFNIFLLFSFSFIFYSFSLCYSLSHSNYSYACFSFIFWFSFIYADNIYFTTFCYSIFFFLSNWYYGSYISVVRPVFSNVFFASFSLSFSSAYNQNFNILYSYKLSNWIWGLV